jgi:hypothetical protein
MNAPDHSEMVLDGMELGRIVGKYGIGNVRLVLDALVPSPSLRAVRIPTTVRRRLEEHLDDLALQQERARDLEYGLDAILDSRMDEWRKRQMAEIVRQTTGGRKAAQIAKDVGVSDATIERRLAELREAAVKASPVCGLFEGLCSSERFHNVEGK